MSTEELGNGGESIRNINPEHDETEGKVEQMKILDLAQSLLTLAINGNQDKKYLVDEIIEWIKDGSLKTELAKIGYIKWTKETLTELFRGYRSEGCALCGGGEGWEYIDENHWDELIEKIINGNLLDEGGVR